MQRFLLALATIGIIGCAEPAPFEETFRSALETAQPGDIIEVPAGTFSFDRSLVMNTDGVTIRGQGMQQSVLSFKNQLAGAEGLSVSASDFVIEERHGFNKKTLGLFFTDQLTFMLNPSSSC